MKNWFQCSSGTKVLIWQSLLRDRADQMQQLRMTSIDNLLCALMHRGTEGEGLITPEKICVVADNNRGACGGKKKFIHIKKINFKTQNFRWFRFEKNFLSWLMTMLKFNFRWTNNMARHSRRCRVLGTSPMWFSANSFHQSSSSSSMASAECLTL